MHLYTRKLEFERIPDAAMAFEFDDEGDAIVQETHVRVTVRVHALAPACPCAGLRDWAGACTAAGGDDGGVEPLVHQALGDRPKVHQHRDGRGFRGRVGSALPRRGTNPGPPMPLQ